MSKNEGKRFEEDIKNSINNDTMYYFRLKDSPSIFNPNSKDRNVRFTLNNPYDAQIIYDYNFFALELKSTVGTSFSFEIEKPKRGQTRKNIKYHQIQGLNEVIHNNIKGANAGFLFNFRDSAKCANIVYYMSIQRFKEFIDNTTKKSINKQDIINYGGIVLQGEVKRVRYRYNIEKLLNTIKVVVKEE